MGVFHRRQESDGHRAPALRWTRCQIFRVAFVWRFLINSAKQRMAPRTIILVSVKVDIHRISAAKLYATRNRTPRGQYLRTFGAELGDGDGAREPHSEPRRGGGERSRLQLLLN